MIQQLQKVIDGQDNELVGLQIKVRQSVERINNTPPKNFIKKNKN